MSFWYKPCPICDGQGRLEIMKNIDENTLFFCCDECMSCWKNREDPVLEIISTYWED